MKNLVSRREMLKLGALGLGSLALGNSLNTFASTANKGFKFGKAKSVIQVWMWGGPSHTDTFDPKPDSGYDYCGPLNKVIGTNVDGIQIGDQLPFLAKLADKYSIVRGMSHGINAHETASYVAQTGRAAGGRIVYPCAGAVVSYLKGYNNGYKGVLPPYIVMTKPQGRFSESGFLGHKYKPFSTGGDPSQKVFAVEGIVAPGISDEQQRTRRRLLHSLDTLGNAMPANSNFKSFNQNEQTAYDLMFGKSKEIFDLRKETEKVRERYGKNKFGQSCLAARRLVEEGVPYVTINYKGWDTHKQHFETMKTKLPEFDRGFSALLNDLSERGLLDSTVVWCTGEFGRGPKIQWKSPWNGGRSHYGKAYSSILAGGGFKGGNVVGATDKYGMEVVERKVHPADLIRSIYVKMGINPDDNFNRQGFDEIILPSSKELSGILTEIM